MHAANKKKLAFAHNIKDTEGNLVVWEEHIGKPIPPIFTTVPLKYVSDPEKVEQLVAMTSGLLGKHGETTVLKEDGTKAPTGELLFRVDELSEDGARKLKRGYWSPVPPEAGKPSDPRGFFAHKGQTIGTIEKPKYMLKRDNSFEIRWDPNETRTNERPFPTKSNIYEALEQAEKMMYFQGIGLSDNEWVDVTTGSVEEEGAENTVSKIDFAAGWRAAQPRVVHALAPAYVIYHGDAECPPLVSHTGRDQANQRAKNDPTAFRIRFPKGYYKENQTLVKLVAEELGIEIRIENHPYPQYAIRDLLASIEAGQAMKEGNICNSRALIKVNCVIAPTCQGVTDPTTLARWLYSKCKVHYVACGMREELTTKGDAPTATTYAYAVLVDVADPTQLMKLTNHSVAGSDSVVIRRWGRMDKGKLKILQNELYVADGAVSVTPQKKQASARATSACDLITQLTEEAKQIATRAGLEQSGYKNATQAQAVQILNLQKRLDLAAGEAKMRELRAQVEALDREDQQAKEALEKEKQQKEREQNAPEPEKQPTSPTKQKRTEVEVNITFENKEDMNITVDTQDVAPEQGQRATVTDLVRHLCELDCFGPDFGIDSAGVKGATKGKTASVKVYVEAVFEGGTEANSWALTVGKDPAAKLKKIDQMHGGTINLTPRVSEKPTSKHPNWLQAEVGEMPSPSPHKTATQVSPELPHSRPSNLRRRQRTNRRERIPTDSRPSTAWKKTKKNHQKEETRRKYMTRQTQTQSSTSFGKNSTRASQVRPSTCGTSCGSCAREEQSPRNNQSSSNSWATRRQNSAPASGLRQCDQGPTRQRERKRDQRTRPRTIPNTSNKTKTKPKTKTTFVCSDNKSNKTLNYKNIGNLDKGKIQTTKHKVGASRERSGGHLTAEKGKMGKTSKMGKGPTRNRNV